MAGVLVWHEYGQDELVFAEKSIGDSFYLIVLGSLTVLMRDKDDKVRPSRTTPRWRARAHARGARAAPAAADSHAPATRLLTTDATSALALR